MSRRDTPLKKRLGAEGFITIEEAAEIATLPHQTIRIWADKGTVGERRIGRRRFVSEADVRREASAPTESELRADGYISITEAGALMGKSAQTVSRMINTGRLTERRVGKLRFVRRDDVVAFDESPASACTPEIVARLGVDEDDVIATAANVAVRTVENWRRSRGIALPVERRGRRNGAAG